MEENLLSNCENIQNTKNGKFILKKDDINDRI